MELQAFMTATTAALLLGSSAFAQLTTLKEDIQMAKSSEARHDYADAERSYRRALTQFPDSPAYPNRSTMTPITVTGMTGGGFVEFGSRSTSSTPTCNCKDGQQCAEILNALLRVLYA